MPNYLSNLSYRSKLVILVLSIFLLSLSVGMLVMGDNLAVTDDLTLDLLKHSKEQIHYIPH
jgi:uncharacterized membrane protein YczE